jgi:hypothetical protein
VDLRNSSLTNRGVQYRRDAASQSRCDLHLVCSCVQLRTGGWSGTSHCLLYRSGCGAPTVLTYTHVTTRQSRNSFIALVWLRRSDMLPLSGAAMPSTTSPLKPYRPKFVYMAYTGAMGGYFYGRGIKSLHENGVSLAVSILSNRQ